MTTEGQLRSLYLPEASEDLDALGFASHRTIGNTLFVPEPGATRLSASIDGVSELDGLQLAESGGEEPVEAGAAHPNGVVSIDHVVVMTPDADRTQASFETAGFEARRIRRFETRDGMRRQTFFWLGDVICEVVGTDEPSGDGPAKWWGLALTVADIDATAAFYGPDCTPVKDAVQPGRRVTTVKSAHARTPMLMISPHGDPS